MSAITCSAPRCVHLVVAVGQDGVRPTCGHSGQQKPYLACTWHTTSQKAHERGNALRVIG